MIHNMFATRSIGIRESYLRFKYSSVAKGHEFILNVISNILFPCYKISFFPHDIVVCM